MDLMQIVIKINGVLWGPIMLFFLLGTGILFTIKLRVIQVRKFKLAWQHTFGGMFKKSDKANKDGMSSYQALTTAIAAQVGTGNLAGVATAISTGGPGAVFWMWVSGFFGMGTIFAEAILAQTHRERVDGEITGGPAYYIRKGLGSKFLAGFFAVAIVLALGFMGNMVQSNSIAEATYSAFKINKLVTGVIVAFIVGLITIGGIGRIASFTEKIVPIMAALYILGSLVIVLTNIEQVGPAFQLIFKSAFSPMAATGGFLGSTVKGSFRYGIARGLFSNEAGMGSTPHAHAIAKVEHPAQQGLVATMGVVIDTGIVCTLTALVILMTGSIYSGNTGIVLTQEGFVKGFGEFGNVFIAICLFFFALSTIIGWYFFGESNIKYLFGKKGIGIYRMLVLVFIVLGTTMRVELVWELADTFNGLMVIPNIIALLGLTSLIVNVTNDFEENFNKNKISNYGNN